MVDPPPPIGQAASLVDVGQKIEGLYLLFKACYDNFNLRHVLPTSLSALTSMKRI